MSLSFHPSQGMVLMCDFTTGFRAPEMVKLRPVIVISPRPRRKTQLCTVVPLSCTAPSPIESHHHQLHPASLPGPLAEKVTWAKCDMLMTVSLDRLDRVKIGKTTSGKRLYATHAVTAADLVSVQKAILAGLGLSKYINIRCVYGA